MGGATKTVGICGPGSGLATADKVIRSWMLGWFRASELLGATGGSGPWGRDAASDGLEGRAWQAKVYGALESLADRLHSAHGVHESDLGREPFEVLHPGAGLHGGPDHLGTGLRRMGAKAAMIWRRWAR